MEVADVTEVIEGPFPVTRTPFFPMLDKGSSFLDLIFAYMSLLNLVVISARMEYFKKVHRKAKLILMTSHLTRLALTLFFFNTKCAQDVRGRIKTKIVKI